MAEVRIVHTYECSEDTFWGKIFLDREYNRRLFLEALGFPRWEVLSEEDGPDEVKRVVEVTPKLGDLPGPLKKILGDGLSYKEEGVFDKKTRRYVSKVIPNRMADKLHVRGEMTTEKLGDNQCRRVFVCTVKADVFGIGGMIEKRTIADMEASYAIAARFTNQYIAEKGLS